MKLIVLAAGYATRLYPLTLNQPKPLLPVAGRPMIEHVLDCLKPIKEIDHVYVVTNEKFSGHFEEWANQYEADHAGLPITVVNDHSTDDSNKLGAIGDMHLVITQTNIDDDILVVAGDNLFSKPLEGFSEFCKARNAPVLGVYDVGDFKEVKKYLAIEVDQEDRIIFANEKPENPKSTLIGIALYFYPGWSLASINQYFAEGNNPDQPGLLIQWLYPRKSVYVWRVPGIWFDIGSSETLEQASDIFSKLRTSQ
ncbi:MAG: nucleotidyltransferase family protein [Pyrinomonadaceae bacterium]